ncbi:MAG: ester cyclase [Solirubrobacteraceae bacterium]|jgi:steroid delta-isomerase-like uncharacterized protein|nr:ester cyclase [Solirubrobacteraceae bacterium]MCU0314122.1 ester cyclase [Solirubrobacteraceae bacterium]
MASTAADPQAPSQLARSVFHRIFDERDLSDPSAFWTEDSVDHFLAAGRTVRGPAALAAWFTDLFAAAPDWQMEIENIVDDGDRQAVIQWRGTGTLTGAPFLGIAPNGRRIEIRGVDVMRFDAGGRIASNTVYYDGAEFARQLGMLPRRDSRLDRLSLAAFNAVSRLRRR